MNDKLKETLFKAYYEAKNRGDAAYQNLMTHADLDQRLYRAFKEARVADDALYSVIKEAGLPYEYTVWESNRQGEPT